MAAATFQQLLLQTSTDGWREGRKVGALGSMRVDACHALGHAAEVQRAPRSLHCLQAGTHPRGALLAGLASPPTQFTASLPLPCRCLQNPEAWLKKELSIKQLSLSLDQHERRGGPSTPAPSPHDSAAALVPLSPRAGGRSTPPVGGAVGGAHSYRPMLRVASVRASALLPAFGWLEVGGW